MKQQSTKEKPVYAVKVDHVTASVWENMTKEGKPFYAVSVQKNYKDGDQWKKGSVFGEGEMPALEAAVRQASNWIWLKRNDLI